MSTVLLECSFSNYVHQFSTGGDFLRYIDHTTPDGLQAVFATNVFGHYLMVKLPVNELHHR